MSYTLASTDRFFEAPHPDAELHILLLDTKEYWEGRMILERHIGGTPLLFQHITHLRLDKQPMQRVFLGYFRRLTHFAVPYTQSGYLLMTDLELILRWSREGGQLERLEAVVVVLWMDVAVPELVREVRNWLARVRKVDGRVYAVEATMAGLKEEWEDEVRGGMSVWERAVAYTESLQLWDEDL
jgi:hypothetical protein